MFLVFYKCNIYSLRQYFNKKIINSSIKCKNKNTALYSRYYVFRYGKHYNNSTTLRCYFDIIFKCMITLYYIHRN